MYFHFFSMELIPNMSSVEVIEATTTTEDTINLMKRLSIYI